MGCLASHPQPTFMNKLQARQVAESLSEKDVVRAHARDELGIDIDELANPMQAAIVSALTFSSGAALPLLSGIFISDATWRLVAIAIAATLGLVLFGVIGAHLGGAGWLRGGTRVLLGGWLALGVSYGVGRAFNVDSAH
jgi:vacuolar iron transporter family protein